MSDSRILVVDDDFVIRVLLESRLNMDGFQAIGAPDGESALSKICAFSFDLIILDIIMPVMDGWELLKIIRNDPVTENTPVILLSAKNSCKDKMIGKDILRANEFFTKPFDLKELICAVRRLC
ncbi:MAG: response regulator [Fibrobacter sp.]|nr:response regulator [Fibrobacter sp.]